GLRWGGRRGGMGGVWKVEVKFALTPGWGGGKGLNSLRAGVVYPRRETRMGLLGATLRRSGGRDAAGRRAFAARPSSGRRELIPAAHKFDLHRPRLPKKPSSRALARDDEAGGGEDGRNQ